MFWNWTDMKLNLSCVTVWVTVGKFLQDVNPSFFIYKAGISYTCLLAVVRIK